MSEFLNIRDRSYLTDVFGGTTVELLEGDTMQFIGRYGEPVNGMETTWVVLMNDIIMLKKESTIIVKKPMPFSFTVEAGQAYGTWIESLRNNKSWPPNVLFTMITGEPENPNMDYNMTVTVSKNEIRIKFPENLYG